MKKTLSLFLAVLMLVSVFSVISINAQETPTISFNTVKGLYVHAVSQSTDSQAWSEWQCVHDRKLKDVNPTEKYFFLPASADSSKVDIYNAYSEAVNVNTTEIPAGKTASVNYEENKAYNIKADNTDYTLRFIKSKAEAAIYVNNSDADGKGTDLYNYLKDDKSISAKATGAIVTPDGKIDNTDIKKIKGRGNTTWEKPKKPFNITYSKAVSVAGMNEGKKYSLLANIQDDSLSRNRFLYDLSDAVGMPYASDSRYVDFYINGYYYGSYQMCEKVEVGKNSLISDFKENDYLNKDGTVKEDFPFLCEVDAGAKKGEDYFVELEEGLKVTIKAPELEEGDAGYKEVKEYVKKKILKFFNAVEYNENLEDIADIDSVAKLYLINELGKNWDAGVSSFFFTYKQDENGKYKFYGSPVWDYDNSLGNANGIVEMLNFFEIYDYTKPTGEWCYFALPQFSDNPIIFSRVKEIWFEKFIPAIEHFTGKNINEEINKDLFTADKYYSLVEKSAEMNYTSGWPLYTSDWIADHSSLTKASFDTQTNTYSLNKYPTSYPQTFKGMYDYCRDWMVSHAAWLSKRYSGKDVNETINDNDEDNPVKPTEKPAEPTEAEKPSEQVKNTPIKATREISLKAGETKKLTSLYKSSFKSSNPKVAIVKNGVITALKKGTAEITEKYRNLSFIYKVKVTTSPKLNKKSISVKLKKTKTVKITGKASSVNNKYKNTKIAKVTSKGSAATIKIKGLKKGKTTLTITVNGVKLKLKVNVKK